MDGQRGGRGRKGGREEGRERIQVAMASPGRLVPVPLRRELGLNDHKSWDNATYPDPPWAPVPQFQYLGDNTGVSCSFTNPSLSHL